MVKGHDFRMYMNNGDVFHIEKSIFMDLEIMVTHVTETSTPQEILETLEES